MIALIDPTAPASPAKKIPDRFAAAYIRTAFWSSTGHRFGECPCCGRMAVLDRLPEVFYEQQPMCSAEGCGVREHDGEPFDAFADWTDLAPETLAQMIADCDQFQAQHGDLIRAAIDTGEVVCGPDFDACERAAHDFWLTRNGHGAGFWDGDWPEPMSDRLDEAAKAFGEFDLYMGDDGKIHHA